MTYTVNHHRHASRRYVQNTGRLVGAAVPFVCVRGEEGGARGGGRSAVGGTDTVIHRGCRRCFKGQGDPGETIRVREDRPLPFQGPERARRNNNACSGGTEDVCGD